MIGQAPQTGGSREIQAMHTPDDVQAMRHGGYVRSQSGARQQACRVGRWLAFGICSIVATPTRFDRICGESWVSK